MDFIETVLEFFIDWPVPIAMGLAYLAGLLVSIILLVRSKARAAILSAVAFGLMLLMHLFASPIANLVFDVLDSDLAHTSLWGFDCCCSALQLAAIVCLIIAIWQAVSPSIPKEVK